MSDEKSALLSGTKEVVHVIHAHVVSPISQREIANGVSFASGARIHISGILQARQQTQFIQRIIAGHQFGVAGVQNNHVLREIFDGVLLAGFHLQFVVVDFLLGKRNDSYSVGIQLLLELPGQTLFGQFARTGEDSENIGHAFSAVFGQSASSVDTDTRSEGRATQHAHRTSVAVFHAVTHRSGRSGSLNEDIATETLSRVGGNSFDSSFLIFHVTDMRRSADVNVHFF